MVPAPPIRRRLVGKALRRHRESSGDTLKDAARFLECDPSKVSRIETGQRGIRSKELRELLDEYGINEPMQAVLTDLGFQVIESSDRPKMFMEPPVLSARERSRR